MDRESIWQRMRLAAREIKRDAVALWFAYRHPRTPLAVKALCVVIVGYALSPVDLVPDFIPVLGYVDDVLLLPGLILLAVRLLPSDVLQQCRAQAGDWMGREGAEPKSFWGMGLVVLIWLAMGYGLWAWWRGR